MSSRKPSLSRSLFFLCPLRRRQHGCENSPNVPRAARGAAVPGQGAAGDSRHRIAARAGTPRAARGGGEIEKAGRGGRLSGGSAGEMLPSGPHRRAAGREAAGRGITGLTGLWRRAGAAGAQCSKAAASKKAAAAAEGGGSGGRTMPGGGAGSDTGRRGGGGGPR